VPIGIGAPVARISTMIIDGNLDMGAHLIKTDNIQSSTPGDTLIKLSAIATPEIHEAVPDRGTAVEHAAYPVLWDTVVSAEIRASDDIPVAILTDVYHVAKYLVCADGYKPGSSLRCFFDLFGQGIQRAYGYIKVNGVQIGDICDQIQAEWQTCFVDITFNAGDEVELWVKTVNANPVAQARNFRLCCTDVASDLLINGRPYVRYAPVLTTSIAPVAPVADLPWYA